MAAPPTNVPHDRLAVNELDPTLTNPWVDCDLAVPWASREPYCAFKTPADARLTVTDASGFTLCRTITARLGRTGAPWDMPVTSPLWL